MASLNVSSLRTLAERMAEIADDLEAEAAKVRAVANSLDRQADEMSTFPRVET